MCTKNKIDRKNTQLKKILSEFRVPLIKIKLLSEKLNYPGFTKKFEESLKILDSNLTDPEKRKQILVKTQILGGVGFWGDSTPFTAHQLGISNEFDEITIQFSIERSKLEKCFDF